MHHTHGIQPGLHDGLEGQEGAGREGGSRGRGYMYTWLIHAVTQQEPTQHCETSSSLKKERKKEMKRIH